MTRSDAYRYYVLGMMSVTYMLSNVDRILMALLLEPIKLDLALSDTELGFLSGIAFGLFYAVVGVPMARWSDRRDRSLISAIAIGLWGLTVMACFLVQNYAQMIAARIAAAVGEAGGKPPTYSLVGDYFPGPAERARALAIYMTGSPVASLITFIAGGWIAQQWGWRMAFLIMGLPGFLVALINWRTIRDPRSRSKQMTVEEPHPSTIDVVRTLWANSTLRHISLSLILLYTLGLGLAPWYAVFMIRVHGLKISEVGLWFGLIFGLGGIFGSLLGGMISARFFADNERNQLRISALTVTLIVPLFLAFLFLPGSGGALIALFAVLVVFSFYLGPTYAMLQRLVRSDTRATTLAVIMLFANLIGFGVGPQLVGIMSDLLRPTLGAESIRYAMLALSLVAIWTAAHFWLASRHVAQDLEANATRAATNTRKDLGPLGGKPPRPGLGGSRARLAGD